MYNEILFFIIGLIFGSFANVCIYRLPIQRSIVKPRSKCTFCKKSITWFHNIPVLSFIFLKGVSKCCNKKISFQYPVVELLTAILFFYSAFTFQLYQASLVSLIIFILLITVTIDLNKQIIFLVFTYIIFFLGLLIQFLKPELNPFNVSLKNSLITAFIAPSLFLILRYIFKKIKNVEALGLGDVYLIASLAIWTGFEKFLYLLIGSSITGIIFYLIFNKRNKENFRIPFGSCIGITFIVLIFI